MIRKQLVRFCIGLLVLGLIATGAGAQRPFDQTSPRAVTAMGASSSVASALDALPASFHVDIADLVVNLRGKPRKEIEDQLRDWAVYGTLIELGVDRDELGKATFKTAPVRLPYLDQAFSFDYGRGRRALLGDRRAILFYDADDPDPIATLGRLADRVRMETGEIPARFQVLAITPDLTTNTIQIDRKPEIAGSIVFGAQYGYVESSAATLPELQAWLAQIDDVTYAGVRANVLYLGGRRSAKSRTKNVTMEDIAALLQAQNALAAARDGLGAQQTRINDQFRAELAGPRLSWSGARATDSEIRAKYEKKMAEINAGPSAPGFSLDPQWNPEGLPETLEKAAANPCSFGQEVFDVLKAGQGTETDAATFRLSSSAMLNAAYGSLESSGMKDARAACVSVRDQLGPQFRTMANAVREARKEQAPGPRANAVTEAMLPFWTASREIGSQPPSNATSLSRAILSYIQGRHQIQCARYDGPLAGTRVGMNLFYTDLLAKLWQSVDYHHASPGTQVPGFLSSPRMRLESKWEAEVNRLPNTRIWFGPKPDSYTRAKGGESVWFQHIATQVFAAGSDPANPHKEEQPAEGSRRSLMWWDRHYEAVADYEQQYHVQNQIEKWSLITGWWSDKLQYLTTVTVDREQRFDRWYDREKSGLRYQFPVPLRPESEWATKTECIDILGSYLFEGFDSGIYSQIVGGVSLGGRIAVEHAPEILAENPWALRQVAPKASEGPWKTAEIQPIYRGPGDVAVELATTTPTRIGAVDARLSKINISYASLGDTEATIAIKSDKGSIGSILGRREAGGVGLRWSPGEVHSSLVEPAALAPPIAATTRALDPALGALKEGDHQTALAYLTRASEGDPVRFRARLDELRAAAIEDADARFAAGDSAGANRGYEAAGGVLGALPPKARMRQALAEIQRGQVNRGLARLTELAGVENDALLGASRGKPGLEELQGLAAAKSEQAPSLFGKAANDVELAAEGAELHTVLKIARGRKGTFVPVEKRMEMLRADRTKLVVYIDGFSFNRADFEGSANGTLTALARSPNVAWTAVEDAGGEYKPSMLVEGGKRIERMPMASEVGSTGDVAANLRAAPHVVFIHNCDADNDGAVTVEERAACNAG